MFILFPGSLMYLNEATLLNNVKVRYNKDHIYVCFLFFYCEYFICVILQWLKGLTIDLQYGDTLTP